jgi:sortase A
MGSMDAKEENKPAGRRRSRLLRRLADAMLIVGGLILAYPFWSAGYTWIQQGRLDSAYQSQSQAFAASLGAHAALPTTSLPATVVVSRLAGLFTATLKAGDPIGRIQIPRIGLNVIVQQGVSGKAGFDPFGNGDLLRNGPVHYAVTPLPGAGDPFAVAGHRTTYSAPFNRLNDLHRGDAIYMVTPYAKFRYSVVKTTVVLPTDITVLADRGYSLVLTTCTPLYSATHRLIVWAQMTSERPLLDLPKPGAKPSPSPS